MEQKLLTVSIDKEFYINEASKTQSVYLRVYSEMFTRGIVKSLKPTNFTVLLAIASFMDEKGNCFPTQRQIAEITGLTLPTVNKAINELLEFTVDGKPILKREFVQVGQFKQSYYTVTVTGDSSNLNNMFKNPEHNITINKDINNNINNSNSYVKETLTSTNDSTMSDIEFNNPKDIAVYFAKKYREKYDVNYNIVFKRDLPLIKKKLLTTFTSEQIKKMIDSAIEHYDELWKKPSYPRPTIPMMCSWLGEQALAVAQDAEKEFEELTELTAGAEELNDDVLKKFGL
jgi:DNA-binding MarR family transcriptional regulator